MIAKTEFCDDQFNEVYPEGIQNNFWNLARNEIILKSLKNYPNAKILDIGCGRGIVTNYLFNNNIDITGVELSNTQPMKNNKAPIFYGTDVFNLKKDFRDKIKIITLFDVLEHIPNPSEFLKNLKKNFVNVEFFILTVPARMELWTNFDDYFGHYKRYTIDEVKKDVESANLKLVKVNYFFNFLYLIIFFSNKIFKSRKIQFKAPSNFLVKFIHKIIAKFCVLENLILPNRCIGTSILFIVKNK